MAVPSLFPKQIVPFKRLTDVEVQTKRKKGLCYRCDEKFTIGHQCKNKELQELVIREIKVTSEEELAHDSSEERAVIGNTEVEKAEANRAIELSINSVVGLTTLGTIKLNYKLGQRR